MTQSAPIYSHVYYLDNFVASRIHDGVTNEPILIDGTAVRGWSTPSPDPRRSGMHYVLFDTGVVYERYDCYVFNSPYGWKVSTVQPDQLGGPV